MIFDSFDKATVSRLLTALAQRYSCDEEEVEGKVIAEWKQCIVSYETNQATLEAIKNIPAIAPVNLPTNIL